MPDGRCRDYQQNGLPEDADDYFHTLHLRAKSNSRARHAPPLYARRISDAAAKMTGKSAFIRSRRAANTLHAIGRALRLD